MAQLNSLGVAFKEWAIICHALAKGQQTLLLRKGGIAESGGSFRMEHQQFWLLPTYVHQQTSGIIESAVATLDDVSAATPPEGELHLRHYALVEEVYHLTDLQKAFSLEGLHHWSSATVEARFKYRQPGLYVIVARIHCCALQVIADTPTYAGCKSWVVLDRELPVLDSQPVLAESTFGAIRQEVERRLISSV